MASVSCKLVQLVRWSPVILWDARILNKIIKCKQDSPVFYFPSNERGIIHWILLVLCYLWNKNVKRIYCLWSLFNGYKNMKAHVPMHMMFLSFV